MYCSIDHQHSIAVRGTLQPVACVNGVLGCLQYMQDLVDIAVFIVQKPARRETKPATKIKELQCNFCNKNYTCQERNQTIFF
jgi:hypothetical protein